MFIERQFRSRQFLFYFYLVRQKVRECTTIGIHRRETIPEQTIFILFSFRCSNILFFSLREPLRSSLLKLTPQQVDSNNNTRKGLIHSLADFVCGGFLGGCISTLFYPINVVKNRMQVFFSYKIDRFIKIF